MINHFKSLEFVFRKSHRVFLILSWLKTATTFCVQEHSKHNVSLVNTENASKSCGPTEGKKHITITGLCKYADHKDNKVGRTVMDVFNNNTAHNNTILHCGDLSSHGRILTKVEKVGQFFLNNLLFTQYSHDNSL